MRRSSSISFVALLLLVLVAGCSDNTVGPGAGSGTLIEATIDGTKFTMAPDVLVSSYTVASRSGQFSGTVAGSPSRNLRILFYTDLDAGTFPRSLEEPDVSLVYIENTASGQVIYDCVDLAPDCVMTITSKSQTSTGSTIINGTFSAKVKNQSDTTKIVTITGGQFSVDLSRN